MIDLKKKVVIVTGGSGFLGSRIAKIISLNNGIPIIIDNKLNKDKSNKYDFFRTDITKLNEVKNSKNRRIICVGTTALRTLETSFENGIFEPINKKTNKFIYPGIDINSIDALITNFHLPKSSLFILICALMGTNKMIKAYEYAIKNNYRFYSYGDACLLEK